MLRAVGHDVRRLKRISYGPIKLGRLPAGKWRELSEAELRALPTAPTSGERERKRGRVDKSGL
jgi:23S rRNA pseudouridine2605 synthase